MGLFRKKNKEEINKVSNTQTINQNTNVNLAQNVMPNTEIKKEESNAIKTQTVTPEVNVNPVQNEKANTEIKKEENNTTNKVEVLDLESQGKKIETKISKKRDLTFLIILFGVVIAFIIVMPIIRNVFVPQIKIKIDNNVQKESENLEFGYIVIGKENSYMRKENIKFYKFTKYENNNLVFNYISDKSVRDANELNIYISIYNKYGLLIHKEKFNQKDLIKKESENSYSFALSDLTYKEAVYAKIDNMVEELREKEIICKSSSEKDGVKLNNEISYKFVDGMLQSYSFIQKYETEKDASKLNENYNKISETLKKTNIIGTDLVLSSNSIYYKIDYSYFEKGEVKFNLRYAKNDYIDYIKDIEKKRDWKCE